MKGLTVDMGGLVEERIINYISVISLQKLRKCFSSFQVKYVQLSRIKNDRHLLLIY